MVHDGVLWAASMAPELTVRTAVEPGSSNQRTPGAPALSPSDTQNQNTNTHPASAGGAAGSTPRASPSVRAGRGSVGLVMEGGIGGSPQQHLSASPVGTPGKEIDTLMGGEPLTETDEMGSTRFYPVFVKSDGTQLPVSAEYLRAMKIDWPPTAPVHMHQDLEAIASELYEQAVANTQQQPQPANRSTHPLSSSAVSGAGGSCRDEIDSVTAAALAQAGLQGLTKSQLRSSSHGDHSPPFSPRGARVCSLGGSFLREAGGQGCDSVADSSGNTGKASGCRESVGIARGGEGKGKEMLESESSTARGSSHQAAYLPPK